MISRYSIDPELLQMAQLGGWGPAIDGTKVGLPDQPLKLLQQGKFNKAPTILGTNENEASMFVPILLLQIGANIPPTDADIVRST